MARIESKTAKRYIRALHDVCGTSEIEQMLRGLQGFAEAWNQNAEFQAALLSPSVPLKEKREVLGDVAESLVPGNGSFRNFLLILLDNRRLSGVQELAIELDLYIKELKKLLALEVTSAFDLPEQERSQIGDQVKRVYGSLASIEWKVDPELVGGLRVQAGDRVLDNTVRSSLERMRASLLG